MFGLRNHLQRHTTFLVESCSNTTKCYINILFYLDKHKAKKNDPPTPSQSSESEENQAAGAGLTIGSRERGKGSWPVLSWPTSSKQLPQPYLTWKTMTWFMVWCWMWMSSLIFLGLFTDSWSWLWLCVWPGVSQVSSICWRWLRDVVESSES